MSDADRPSETCWDPPAGRPSFSETQSQPGLENFRHPKTRRGLKVSGKIHREPLHSAPQCFCCRVVPKAQASTPAREKQGGSSTHTGSRPHFAATKQASRSLPRGLPGLVPAQSRHQSQRGAVRPPQKSRTACKAAPIPAVPCVGCLVLTLCFGSAGHATGGF